jgi:hypothetical protein
MEIDISKNTLKKKKKAIKYLEDCRRNLDLGEHKLHSQLSRRI